MALRAVILRFVVDRAPPTGRWLAKLNALSYLPIKIKTPAISATTPITIAPIPM